MSRGSTLPTFVTLLNLIVVCREYSVPLQTIVRFRNLTLRISLSWNHDTPSDLIIVSKQLTWLGAQLLCVEHAGSMPANSHVWQFIIVSVSSKDVVSFSGFNALEPQTIVTDFSVHFLHRIATVFQLSWVSSIISLDSDFGSNEQFAPCPHSLAYPNSLAMTIKYYAIAVAVMNMVCLYNILYVNTQPLLLI